MNMNMNMSNNNSHQGGDFPEDEDRKSAKLPSMTSTTTSSSSPSWLKLKNPRIVRVSRAFGGKDRHSKVCTVRGLRDRRIRLSVPTAIQLYDLQDRLGLNQPSKVVDWLINAAKDDIDDLPPLQMPPLSFISRTHHTPPQLLNISPAGPVLDWAGERSSSTTFLKGKSKDQEGAVNGGNHNHHQVSSGNNNYMSSWEPNFGGFDHHQVPLPAQILVCPTAATTTTQPYFPEQMSQFQMLMMSSADASASHNHNHHLLHNSSAHLYSARPFFTHVGAPQNDGESEQDKNQEHFQER